MSTKTNFKRIALVAVAALGMGVLSSVPSQAVGNADSLTVATGTQYTTAAGGSIIADSGTAATAAFQFLASSSYDTYTLVASLKSAPASNTRLPMFVVDTVSMAGVTAAVSRVVSVGVNDVKNKNDTITANTSVLIANAAASSAATAGIAYAKFKVMIAEPTVAGTYVVNIKSTPTDASSSDSVPADGVDVTITVSAASAAADQANSKAQMNSGSSWSSLISLADSSVAVAMTASTTPRAVIRVALADSTGVATYTNESVTITTTVGTVGTATTAGSIGRSVKFDYANSGVGYKDFGIFADGTAGTATITISTPSVTFATKTVAFYSTTSSKIVATKALNTLSVGSNSNAVLGKATDANGNVVGADATSTGVYAYSSNTAVVSDSGTACTYDTTYQIHKCALTGVAAGTAKITLRNSSTAGTASTVNSAETIEVTVNANAAATLKMEFSKTTYAPGEKGYLIISALDSAGKAVGPQALTALLAGSGISRAGSFSGTEPTWSLLSYTLAANTALLGASFTTAEAASVSTVYMPYSGGTVSVSATGGTSLPVAGQVKVTATATVTDSGAAALAAVNALATTVASLRTLITTLTNLVLKIQKKVKA
jgi:trimeric autotransporter adhesin